MPKVLLIARDFPPEVGGIATFLKDVYCSFSREELIVVAYRNFRHTIFEDTFPYEVVRTGAYSRFLQRNKFAMIPLFLKALVVLLRSRDIAEIHADQVQSGFVALVLSRLFATPYALFAYGMEITTSDRFGLKKGVYRRAKRVVSISEYTRGLLLRSEVMHTSVKMVRPGVPTSLLDCSLRITKEDARRNLGIDNSEKVILTVARLAPTSRYKGIDQMIRAFRHVRNRVPEARYYIVGSGADQSRLEELVNLMGLDGLVFFTGLVQEEVKMRYLCACDVFVLPNRIEYERGGEVTEGFGIVFLEANAFSKPVVGGDGGARDAVEDEVSGFHVDPLSEFDIAEKVCTILTNAGLAKRLGEQGKTRVIQRFIAENIAKSFHDDLFEEIKLSGRGTH
jgi:phosphatidylinositol alpha-1,6-mannosyltransferase